jgi:hypothetical protein
MVVPSGLADSLNLPNLIGLTGAASAKLTPPGEDQDQKDGESKD